MCLANLNVIAARLSIDVANGNLHSSILRSDDAPLAIEIVPVQRWISRR